MQSLPVLEIITKAYATLFRNFPLFIHLATIPVVITMLVVFGIHSLGGDGPTGGPMGGPETVQEMPGNEAARAPNGPNSPADAVGAPANAPETGTLARLVATLMVTAVLMVPFLTCWQRLVVLGRGAAERLGFGYRFGASELLFLRHMLILIPGQVGLLLFTMLIVGWLGNMGQAINPALLLFGLVILFGLLYLLAILTARLPLVLAAASLGQVSSFHKIWQQSRGHLLSLIALVFLAIGPFMPVVFVAGRIFIPIASLFPHGWAQELFLIFTALVLEYALNAVLFGALALAYAWLQGAGLPQEEEEAGPE